MVDPLTAAITAIAAPFVADLAKDIVKDLAKDAAKDGGKGLLGWSKEQVQLKFSEASKASKAYVEAYQDRHCMLKPLGMRQPIALDSIYTAVRFLDNYALRQLTSARELEIAFRETRNLRLRQRDCKTQAGIEVANSTQFLMVLGAPGAGKSTFLRKMGLEALKGTPQGFQHRCIPVFLELKRLVDRKIDLEQRLVSEFETCGFPDAKRFTSKALEQGKLLILLDGLDEVPSDNLNRVIQTIQDFVDRYPKNRYIASCRIAAYRSGFHRFTDVAMAEFDDVQIQQFIRNWFSSPEDRQADTASKCWKLLQQRTYAGAKELAHTPLLLTFLCLAYDRSLTFPNNRAVLYQKALRILLEEWAAEKRLDNQRKIYEGLNIELEERLLAKIAIKSFAKDRLFFSQKELVEQIKNFLANNLNAPKQLDGEAVLDAIVVQQGILVERADDVYSFSHLTLQEYLTAQYIADNPQLLPDVVSQYLTNKSWREVFLLIAGRMTSNSGVDRLLLRMEKQARSLINTPKLVSLLRWADQATAGSKGKYEGAEKRSVAIFLALALTCALKSVRVSVFDYIFDRVPDYIPNRALAHVIDGILEFTRVIEEIIDLEFTRVLSIARSIDFKKIEIFKSVSFAALISDTEALRSEVSFNQPYEIRRAFAEKILQLWFNVIGLDHTSAMLSVDEAKALSHYLYANELIVRCKEAAVEVSPQVWAAIEDRMLRLPD